MIIDASGRTAIINNGSDISLTNICNIDYNWNEHEFILHKSVITGKETLVSKGTRAVTALDVIGLTYAQYRTLKGLRTSTAVTFYPYGKDNVVIGESTYTAPSISMLVKAVKPYHMNEVNYCDAVHIEMESQSYYELAMAVVGS